MLAIENIHAGYGQKNVLQEVSINVAPGEFLGLIGPNGCGKTTLLRVISGILSPSQGSVKIKGEPLKKISRRKLAGIMACLLQNLSLELDFTVREVVLMGRWPHIARLGRQSREDLDATQRAMELSDVAHLADRLITQISGGEKQRVYIAMCLAQQPQILLLDEPTNHLDIGHQLSMLDIIRKLNDESGMTVVSVFHDLNLACEYCDRIVLLYDGKVEAIGSPAEVFTAERIHKLYTTNVLMQQNPISGKPHVVIAAGMNGKAES